MFLVGSKLYISIGYITYIPQKFIDLVFRSSNRIIVTRQCQSVVAMFQNQSSGLLDKTLGLSAGRSGVRILERDEYSSTAYISTAADARVKYPLHLLLLMFWLILVRFSKFPNFIFVINFFLSNSAMSSRWRWKLWENRTSCINLTNKQKQKLQPLQTKKKNLQHENQDSLSSASGAKLNYFIEII